MLAEQGQHRLERGKYRAPLKPVGKEHRVLAPYPLVDDLTIGKPKVE